MASEEGSPNFPLGPAFPILRPHHHHSLPHRRRLHLLPALPQHPPHLRLLHHRHHHRLLRRQAERDVLLQLWTLFPFVFGLLHHPEGELNQQPQVLFRSIFFALFFLILWTIFLACRFYLWNTMVSFLIASTWISIMCILITLNMTPSHLVPGTLPVFSCYHPESFQSLTDVCIIDRDVFHRQDKTTTKGAMS